LGTHGRDRLTYKCAAVEGGNDDADQHFHVTYYMEGGG